MVPFAAAAPWPGALDRLRVSGFMIVAMTPDDEAMDIGRSSARPRLEARSRCSLAPRDTA